MRIEAGKLRARLAKYYAQEGGGDPLLIELPKSGYSPAFREREKLPERPQLPRAARVSTRQLWVLVVLA